MRVERKEDAPEVHTQWVRSKISLATTIGEDRRPAHQACRLLLGAPGGRALGPEVVRRHAENVRALSLADG